MDPKFKFQPLGKAWVAIHPDPVGVINFIGGAFFGTFPTFFYRDLLKQLFERRYTVIALPYRFTFRHWSVALNLARDLSELRPELLLEAQRLGYKADLYAEDPCAEARNYFWLGHSLGNKYIALLELLSDLEFNDPQTVLASCVPAKQVQTIQQQLQSVDLHSISLMNQPSVLMAPAITGIESAIPVRAIANIVRRFIDVQPTVAETYCLIEKSRLFNLIGLIAFKEDTIAAETVDRIRSLPNRPAAFAELQGGHLAPLGVRRGDRTLADTVLQFLADLAGTQANSPQDVDRELAQV